MNTHPRFQYCHRETLPGNLCHQLAGKSKNGGCRPRWFPTAYPQLSAGFSFFTCVAELVEYFSLSLPPEDLQKHPQLTSLLRDLQSKYAQQGWTHEEEQDLQQVTAMGVLLLVRDITPVGWAAGRQPFERKGQVSRSMGCKRCTEALACLC